MPISPKVVSDLIPKETGGPPLDSKSLTQIFKFSKFETPLVIRQVESHLVFGPLARHFPSGWIAFTLAVVFLAVMVATSKSVWDSLTLLMALPALFYLWLLTRTTRRQQAAVLWVMTKSSLGIFALLVVPMALGLWLRDNRSDLRPVVFLFLIWFPALEFIPNITPHQRYLTLARLGLSVPFVIEIIKDPRNTWS